MFALHLGADEVASLRLMWISGPPPRGRQQPDASGFGRMRRSSIRLADNVYTSMTLATPSRRERLPACSVSHLILSSSGLHRDAVDVALA